MAEQKDFKPASFPIRKFILFVLQILLVLSVLAGLLFIPAGRLDWPEAWFYVVAYGIFLAAYAAWGLLKDPEQLEERGRGRTAGNEKSWDRVILSLYTIFLVALFIVCGLDAGRFHWSSIHVLSRDWHGSGLAGAGTIIFWTLMTNTYLSRVARIQSDRGQVVVTSGPIIL